MSGVDVSVERARRIAVQRLESLSRAGVTQLRRGHPAIDSPATAKPQEVAAVAGAQHETPTPMTKTPSNKQSALSIIQQEVAACIRCQELADSRTQTVFGVGNPDARLCFFGEAPGADEDRQGEPFVGRAGKLLTDIIKKGMGLERSDIYILNVLKCRPPGNRNPSPDEAGNCREYFERQIETIDPEFICCLGSIAAHTLLETNIAVGKLRGKIHDYRGRKVVVTYHPAYLLRNPSAKKHTWDDIQILMREMGLPVP
ncbi:MAG: uracil-DNA glycosylase [Planctomycetaceae bacterium]|nr:uracil-DNA glycosylase [Planctomycetaceae bacterium]